MSTNLEKFGLENVYAWPIETYDENDLPTYGTPIRIRGAVDLTLDASQDSTPFYADNVVYYMSKSNSGYEGTLQVALLPKAFRTEVLGEQEDAAGVMVESAEPKEKEFALAFQFAGDAHNTRHLFYRVSANRPPVAGGTVNNTKTPQTDTVPITAMPRIDNKLVKASAAESSPAYTTWNTVPYEPDFTIPEG